MDKPALFVSHKHEDAKAAEYLAQRLRLIAPGLLDVHISEEVPFGGDWFDWITSKLARSQVLLMLFTESSSQWDWCLFEVGLFTGGRKDPRVVCIHGGKKLPGPLEHRQAVHASTREIAKFLSHLCKDDDYFGLGPAVKPDVPADWIEETASKLKKLLAGTNKSVPFVKQLVIEVKDRNALRGDRIPRGAGIIDPDQDSLGLFEKVDGRWTWGDLERSATATSDEQWIKDLAKIFSVAARKGTPRPIQSVFHPPGKPGKCYRPLLYKVDWRFDRSVRFHVVFTEEPNRNSDIVTTPVTSFGALMSELQELIESAKAHDVVRVLAYTPALGFLARTEEEWEKLKSSMESHAKQLSITCLHHDDLAKWHKRFVLRRTERGLIEASLTEEATEVSAKLLEKVGRARRLKWRELPEYYLFSNRKRAIIVTPFFIPRLDDPHGEENPENLHNVEMFGLTTNDPEILLQVNRVQDYYLYLARPTGGSSGQV